MVKLYLQLCYMQYMQTQIHGNDEFKQKLKGLLKNHPNVDITAMGFIDGWENEPLWK